MSKFNLNTNNSNLVANNEGAKAYVLDDKTKLVSMVLTSFYSEAKFYGDNSKELLALAEELAKKEPAFVAALAAYARREFNLRSVAHVLTTVVAHEEATKPFIKQVVNAVVVRADDLLEILACYINLYGKPIPNGLKKALASNLKKFNEFQLSKYNGGSKSVKFKDILNITHVKPDNEEQALLFKKILEDNLEIAVRWETELSAKGNNKETWEELIGNNEVPYMALLRNLRNIVKADVSCMDVVNAKIMDEKSVLNSKQLPFRYLSAYRELSYLSGFTTKTKEALESAVKTSLKNVHKIPGRTVIAYDVSGSMRTTLSGKSNVRCSDISALLAVMASSICEESIVYKFNNRLDVVSVSPNPNILSETEKLSECEGGTSLELPLKKMVDDKIVADRLILISDNEINSYYGYQQTCQALADQYRKKVNSNLWIHAIDLEGYGTTQFKGKKTNIISGWSEKVFDFIALVEGGMDNLVASVASYTY